MNTDSAINGGTDETDEHKFLSGRLSKIGDNVRSWAKDVDDMLRGGRPMPHAKQAQRLC